MLDLVSVDEDEQLAVADIQSYDEEDEDSKHTDDDTEDGIVSDTITSANTIIKDVLSAENQDPLSTVDLSFSLYDIACDNTEEIVNSDDTEILADEDDVDTENNEVRTTEVIEQKVPCDVEERVSSDDDGEYEVSDYDADHAYNDTTPTDGSCDSNDAIPPHTHSHEDTTLEVVAGVNVVDDREVVDFDFVSEKEDHSQEEKHIEREHNMGHVSVEEFLVDQPEEDLTGKYVLFTE